MFYAENYVVTFETQNYLLIKVFVMLKNFFLIALLFIMLVSCKTKIAFNFNQAIVNKEQVLLPDITSTEEKIGKYFELQQFDSISIAGAKMSQKIQKAIDEIKAIHTPDLSEAENFKAAYLRYFAFMKSAYTTYESYGKATTDEERYLKMEELQTIVSRRLTITNEVLSAQKKFAVANGLRIENNNNTRK